MSAKSNKAKKTWKVPILADGSIPHYVSYYEERLVKEWKDPDYVFEAVLEFQHTCRGQSAAYFIFKNKASEATYPILMSDMEDLLKTHSITSGVVSGEWTVVKKGQNYGIKARKM